MLLEQYMRMAIDGWPFCTQKLASGKTLCTGGETHVKTYTFTILLLLFYDCLTSPCSQSTQFTKARRALAAVEVETSRTPQG